MHAIQGLHSNGRKANWRHENWVYNFIPWKSVMPTNTRARSKRQLKWVAVLSPRWRGQWLLLIENRSRTWRQNIGCRRYSSGETMLTAAALLPSDPNGPDPTGVEPRWAAKFF